MDLVACVLSMILRGRCLGKIADNGRAGLGGRPGTAWLTGQRADGGGERPGTARLTGQRADGGGERPGTAWLTGQRADGRRG